MADNGADDMDELFDAFRDAFPARWRADGWYLSAVGALMGSGLAARVGDLYSFLVSLPGNESAGARRALVRRLREAVVKCVVINGIPAAFVALGAVAARERDEDKDYSALREGWTPTRQSHDAAMAFLERLYGDELPRIYERYAAHRDLPWLSTEISYGLFLADSRILDLRDTELVVMPAILCQNLAAPAAWHLRGCLRAGLAHPEVEQVQRAAELVAARAGRRLDAVPRVADVED